MIMDHPPPRRRPNPDRGEPPRPIGPPPTSENVLASRNRLIRPDRPNVEVIVAEHLQRFPRPPESSFLLTFNATDPVHQPRRAHRRRSIDVRREINRQLAAIPSRRRRIENSLDRGSVAHGLKSGIRAHLSRAGDRTQTRRTQKKSSHYLDSG